MVLNNLQCVKETLQKWRRNKSWFYAHNHQKNPIGIEGERKRKLSEMRVGSNALLGRR